MGLLGGHPLGVRVHHVMLWVLKASKLAELLSSEGFQQVQSSWPTTSVEGRVLPYNCSISLKAHVVLVGHNRIRGLLPGPGSRVRVRRSGGCRQSEYGVEVFQADGL